MSRAARAREAGRVAETLPQGGWIFLRKDPHTNAWRATGEARPLLHLDPFFGGEERLDQVWAANWVAELYERFDAHNLSGRSKIVGFLHIANAVLSAAYTHASRPPRAVLRSALNPIREWLHNNPEPVPALAD